MSGIGPYLLLVVAVAVAAIVMLVAFTLLRNYRQRRLRSSRDDAANPSVAGDRAYNRLALARREADLYAAQGGDVERARQLIDLASRSLDSREFDRAYSLAQSAHETLVTARRGPLRRSPAGGAPAPENGPAADALPPLPSAAVPPREPAPATAAPAIPKNRAEAQFQLRLFEEDLVAARKKGPKGQPAGEARDLYVQAHAAFARGDYAEAFRLSLRGRRRVGAHIEALGPSAAAPTRTTSTPTSSDPAEAAEALAAQDRCASCGEPRVAGDSFCRGCGAPRSPATCPSCGAPRAPKDAFCGRCGSRYP